MKKWIYLLLTVLIMVISLPVAAKDTQVMIRQAQVLFTRGKYRKSLDILQQVYKVLPGPVLLWNMGRCMEAMKDYEGALKKYREFELVKGLSVKQRERVSKGIKRVRGRWIKQLLVRADKMVEKGEVKAGKIMYQKAWQVSRDAGVLEIQAGTLRRAGRKMDAIAAYMAFIAATKDKDEKLAAQQEIKRIKLNLQEDLLKKADLTAKKGNLQGAMTLLDRAYGLRDDPVCLWQRAGIYEHAGRKVEAIKWYKAYIKQHPGTKQVKAARARIVDLQPRKKRYVKTIATVRHVKNTVGRSLKTGGYILAGTAVAAIATGIVFTLLANRDYSSLRNAGQNKHGLIIGMDQETAADLQSTAGSERTVSWVMYGVGAAMAAASVALIVVGHKKSKIHAFAAPTMRGVSLGFQTRF